MIKNSEKILIIGHKGYVGHVLIKYLKQYSLYRNSLFGVDYNLFTLNGYYKNKKLLKDEINLDCRKFKISNLKFKPNVIVYLAAVSNDPMGSNYKYATEEINYKYCIKLAKEAKKLKIAKFIFASSCSMYGSAGNSKRKESDKLYPLTDYAKSKVNSEKNLKTIASKEFKVISMRFATAAGLSTNLRLDLVFNDFIASSVLTKKIELLSSGNSWRPLIHVRDMSRAIKWAIEYKSKKNFLPINIGSDKWNFKIIKLAEKISKIVKGAKIIVKDKKNVDKRSYKVNFNLFKKLAPRHQPNTNFRASVIELKNFLFKEKKNLKNFRNSPKWSRLSMLNYLVKNKKIDKKLLLIKKHDR